MATRFSMVSLTSEAGATENTRAAAALTALDFPLNKARTLTSIAGDGVKGLQVTWHFEKECPQGNSSALALKEWDNPKRAKEHPDCPLVAIKAAFIRSAELARFTRDEDRLDLPGPCPPPFCETPDTRKAAAMERLGHPLKGVRRVGVEYRFQFAQAAAADFAAWDTPGLDVRLPDSLITYLWCSFDNHRLMVDAIKQQGAQFAAVRHRERVAYVGRDMPKTQLDQLDRLLHRP